MRGVARATARTKAAIERSFITTSKGLYSKMHHRRFLDFKT
jgi:hypothetical protein